MNRNYKYHLEPYSPSSKRTCPKCGRKKCFTLYLDRDNRPAGDQYGICDHTKECGYRLYPTGRIDNSAIAPVVIEKVDPIYYTRQQVSNYTLYKYNNGLSRFLQPKFKKSELTKVFRDYCIGSVDYGIIFWQIDEQYRVHRGKVMWYNPDGHRTKIQNPDGTERGRIKMMWQFLHRDRATEPEMCYFGQHLVSLYPDKPVALVESEKTCLIASLIEPQYNWIATLSINNFQTHRLDFLKNFQNYVLVFPDRDGFDKWKEKTAAIQNLMPNLKIGINDFILQYGNGKEDLADVFLRYC